MRDTALAPLPWAPLAWCPGLKLWVEQGHFSKEVAITLQLGPVEVVDEERRSSRRTLQVFLVTYTFGTLDQFHNLLRWDSHRKQSPECPPRLFLISEELEHSPMAIGIISMVQSSKL